MKIKLLIKPLLALIFFYGCSTNNNDQSLKEFYPLDFCIVTGNDLGDMGKPVNYDYNGTFIRFCCHPCIPKFQKNPTKYLVLLREELEAELEIEQK